MHVRTHRRELAIIHVPSTLERERPLEQKNQRGGHHPDEKNRRVVIPAESWRQDDPKDNRHAQAEWPRHSGPDSREEAVAAAALARNLQSVHRDDTDVASCRVNHAGGSRRDEALGAMSWAVFVELCCLRR